MAYGHFFLTEALEAVLLLVRPNHANDGMLVLFVLHQIEK